MKMSKKLLSSLALIMALSPWQMAHASSDSRQLQIPVHSDRSPWQAAHAAGDSSTQNIPRVSLWQAAHTAGDGGHGEDKAEVASDAPGEAAARACAGIMSVIGEPQELKDAGKLDNAIRVSRRIALDYIAETEKSYDAKSPSASQVIKDLEALKNISDIVISLGQEMYGSGFTDFEVMNACRSLMPKAGDILSGYGVAMSDAMILGDPFCVPAAMKVTEGEVRRLRESHADSSIVLEKEMSLLDYYSALGYRDEAIGLGKRLLPAAKRAGDRENVLRIMDVLAEEYRARGNFHESERVIGRKLRYIEKNPGGQSEKDTLSAKNDLVRLYFMRHMHEEGLKLLNDIIPAAGELPDEEPVKGKVLLSACMALDSQGLYEKANELYAKVADSTLDISIDKLRVMGDIVRHKIFYGFALSDDLMLAMTDSALLGRDHHATLMDLCNLSGDYLRAGNLADSISVAERVMELSSARYGALYPVSINAKLRLAEALRQKGEYERALQLDGEAHAGCEKLYGKDSAMTLVASLSLAEDYAAVGETAAAIKRYEDGIINYRKNYGSTDNELPWSAMNRLAALCVKTGRYQEALRICDDIMTTKRNFQGRISPEDTNTLLTMARAFRLSGDHERAADYYDKTLLAYEGVRRHAVMTDEYLSGWFAGIVPVYKEQMLTYIDSKKTAAELLRLSDLCKARNLSDRYNEYLALERSDLADDDREAVRDLGVRASAIDEAMEKARQEGNGDLYLSLEVAKLSLMMDEHRQKTALSKKYPAYKAAREVNLAEGSLFTEKLDAIPSGSFFIDYAVLPGKILVTIARHGKAVRCVPVDIDEKFLSQCEIYRKILSVPDADAFYERYGYLYRLDDGSYEVLPVLKESGLVTEKRDFVASRETLSSRIGSVLLSPIDEYIPKEGVDLIISPDGPLSNIPFETLTSRDGLLIERADVSYVPSLSVLKMMRQRGKSKGAGGRTLFAVGAVDYGRYSASKGGRGVRLSPERGGEPLAWAISKMEGLRWDFLPNTGDEVKNVAALFPRRCDILSGIHASERSLKEMDRRGELKKYRYLLFSTHGMYVPPRPELSSIILRPDDTPRGGHYEYNGYVTVGEWMGYHLESDLVYLSACESGLGRFLDGEGIVGVPYGLTVAGNKSTVMSLWNIGDRFASDFTTGFFTRLSQGKSPKAALSETKRRFIADRKYSSPSLWSAFLLYGE